jgi:hypothetical protein
MKHFSIFTLVRVQALMIMLVISGCAVRSPQVVPTASPVDIQGTVAAAAFTGIAETQAAIPTATPPPPTATFTDTPVPTTTLPPLPSSEAALTPVAGGNSGTADPCIAKALPVPLQGEPVKIRIDNPTRAALMLSVYLLQAGPGSECGYRSYALDPGGSLVINDLVEGCYTLWAWNPDPKGYFMVTNGTSCLDNSKSWTFDISTRSIQLRQ